MSVTYFCNEDSFVSNMSVHEITSNCVGHNLQFHNRDNFFELRITNEYKNCFVNDIQCDQIWRNFTTLVTKFNGFDNCLKVHLVFE